MTWVYQSLTCSHLQLSLNIKTYSTVTFCFMLTMFNILNKMTIHYLVCLFLTVAGRIFKSYIWLALFFVRQLLCRILSSDLKIPLLLLSSRSPSITSSLGSNRYSFFHCIFFLELQVVHSLLFLFYFIWPNISEINSFVIFNMYLPSSLPHCVAQVPCLPCGVQRTIYNDQGFLSIMWVLDSQAE